MPAEIFDSCMRSRGDLAGVFEYDGETGYFYLYASEDSATNKVLDAIRVVSGQVDFEESDISVRWSASEDKVGLFIRETLWAVFDAHRHLKHGGGYATGARPSLSPDATEGFET